ncbi:hypothetical protein [Phenylobacterium sp.]|jgi:hypothetical protein
MGEGRLRDRDAQVISGYLDGAIVRKVVIAVQPDLQFVVHPSSRAACPTQ